MKAQLYGNAAGYLNYEQLRDQGMSHEDVVRNLKYSIVQGAILKHQGSDRKHRRGYIAAYWNELVKKLPKWEAKYEKVLAKRQKESEIEEASRKELCTLLDLDPSYSPENKED